MIKLALIKSDGRKLLGFGITEQNVILLKDGKPIYTSLDELTIPDTDIVIFYATTEDKMVEFFKKAGFIKDESEIKDQHLKEKTH